MPLWQDYPGKRDGLAQAVGTTGSVLSSINSGRRNLGLDLGQRLARELDVTILDLGAPSQALGEQAERVVDRLTALEDALAELQLEIDALRRRRGDAR